MNIESLISDLAFILLLGAVVTVVFKWIRQPVVLGYIVAGFLASPHFTYLPSVANEANIDFWAQIGIVVLLFTLGLEFSFKKLVTAGGSAVVTALIIVCGMMGVGYCIGYAMGFSTINCLFLGGMLSMSSTTIIIKAFNDLGIRQKKFASLVLAVLIVEDLFAVVMMVILSSIAVNNAVEGEALLMSVAKLVFFLVMWFLVGVFVLPWPWAVCGASSTAKRYWSSPWGCAWVWLCSPCTAGSRWPWAPLSWDRYLPEPVMPNASSPWSRRSRTSSAPYSLSRWV